MSDMTGQSAAGGYRPAGWYHAQGDPPGTQRYWDGSSWQGEPQPVNPTTRYGSTEHHGAPESYEAPQSYDPPESPAGRSATGSGHHQAASAPASTASPLDPATAPAEDWATPPPEVPTPGGPSGAGTGGFLSALFDTKFNSYITGRAISVVYTLALVAITLITLFFVLSGLTAGGSVAVVSLIIGPLTGLFYLVMIRLTLEFFVNQVRQTELLEMIADRLGRESH